MHSLTAKSDESYLVFLHLKTSQFCLLIAVKISPSPHLMASTSGVLKFDGRKGLNFDPLSLDGKINYKNVKISL